MTISLELIEQKILQFKHKFAVMPLVKNRNYFTLYPTGFEIRGTHGGAESARSHLLSFFGIF